MNLGLTRCKDCGDHYFAYGRNHAACEAKRAEAAVKKMQEELTKVIVDREITFGKLVRMERELIHAQEDLGFYRKRENYVRELLRLVIDDGKDQATVIDAAKDVRHYDPDTDMRKT